MSPESSLEHAADSHPALRKVHELYHVLLDHDGFGELRMDIRILKRGQKEVIVSCGKQYRFVVDAESSEDKKAERARSDHARHPGEGG